MSSPTGLNGVTKPLITKALASIKHEATAHYQTKARNPDGHFKAGTRTVGRLRLSARVHRNGVEEISLTVTVTPNTDPTPLPPETIQQVITIHQKEFGVLLESALSAPMPGGGLAWVVLRPVPTAHSQDRLI